MRIYSHKYLLIVYLTAAFIFLYSTVRSQTADTIRTINFPLLHEDFSLYEFVEIRFEGMKMWTKFTLHNNLPRDTSVALIFPQGVSKAVLYRSEGKKLIAVGKTGYIIAVLARSIFYEDARIDVPLKALSKTNFVVLTEGDISWLPAYLFKKQFLPLREIIQRDSHIQIGPVTDYYLAVGLNRNTAEGHANRLVFRECRIFGSGRKKLPDRRGTRHARDNDLAVARNSNHRYTVYAYGRRLHGAVDTPVFVQSQEIGPEVQNLVVRLDQ